MLIRCFLFSMWGSLFWVVVLSLLIPMKSKGADLLPDTLSEKTSYLLLDDTHFHDVHRIKVPELVIPLAGVGVASLFVRNEKLVGYRNRLQSVLCYKEKKMRGDDYFQYLPMLAVYGVNFTKKKGVHRFWDRTILLAISYATMGIVVNSMKYTICELRPDGRSFNSFPSGHTATAFMGAEFLRKEYGEICPWIGYSGYLVALATGYLRIYNNRHYIHDVVAGACIGMLSTKFAYWIYPKLFKRFACKPNKYQLYTYPTYSDGRFGFSLNMQF